MFTSMRAQMQTLSRMMALSGGTQGGCMLTPFALCDGLVGRLWWRQAKYVVALSGSARGWWWCMHCVPQPVAAGSDAVVAGSGSSGDGA